MNADNLRARAKSAIKKLGNVRDTDSQFVGREMQTPSRFMLIGEHYAYGDRYMWGFRHTIEDAAGAFFDRPWDIGTGCIGVNLAYIYDLHLEVFVEIGVVEKTVKIGPLVFSDLHGVKGRKFVPGDTVVIRAPGKSRRNFCSAVVLDVLQSEDGETNYSVCAKHTVTGDQVFSVWSGDVFRPCRHLPYSEEYS